MRIANELKEQELFISPDGVISVGLRHDLERLKALKTKADQENLILTEAHGEIETEHPGYLGSQDTFYVGTLKG